ncbi:hypothetical protein, partial [Listeria monocytogenes]|uniref:hypothetical protein n=1 Tax=Listeria monocytogenes TaxID=1639 RepID=UPI001969483E
SFIPQDILNSLQMKDTLTELNNCKNTKTMALWVLEDMVLINERKQLQNVASELLVAQEHLLSLLHL